MAFERIVFALFFFGLLQTNSAAQGVVEVPPSAPLPTSNVPLGSVLDLVLFPISAFLPLPSKQLSITTELNDEHVNASIARARALKPADICTALATELFGGEGACSKLGRVSSDDFRIDVVRSDRGGVAFDVTISARSSLLSNVSDKSFERLDLVVEALLTLEGNLRIVTSLENAVQDTSSLDSIARAEEKPFESRSRRLLKNALGRISLCINQTITQA